MKSWVLMCALLLWCGSAVAQECTPSILGCLVPDVPLRIKCVEMVPYSPLRLSTRTPAITAQTDVEQQVDSAIRTLAVFPNPTSGQVTVRLQSGAVPPAGSNAGTVRVSVATVLGEIVMTVEGQEQDSRFVAELDFGHYAAGMYIITVESGGRTWTQSVVRE